jgi:hypothetical protein
VEKVRENLRVAHICQKSYADKKRRELTFAVGDRVYLKVSPLQGTKRFLVKGKLASRYVGLYQITKKIGSLTYQLALPETLSGVHPVFYVSQLKRRGEPPFHSARCCGVTTLSERLHGRRKLISGRSTLTYS